MFEDLIIELQKRAPPRKEGGGFFSGPLNSIEYGNSININKVRNDLKLSASGFEVAGLNGNYVFAMDREYLYCRSGYTYAMLPPSDNVHEFEVSRSSTSAAMGAIKQDWEMYAIPLRKIERGVKLS